MDPPVSDQKAEHLEDAETESECEQALSTTLNVGGLSLVSKEDSAAALETGATANLARLRCLEQHNQLLGRRGSQWVSTNPSKVRFRLGDGRLGKVRHADIPVGIAGNDGGFTAFALDADIPALLREGAREELGGQLGF